MKNGGVYLTLVEENKGGDFLVKKGSYIVRQ